jgi:hypothetical protein
MRCPFFSKLVNQRPVWGQISQVLQPEFVGGIAVFQIAASEPDLHP